MKTKLFSVLSILCGFLGFSQTKVYFRYDEAGNQIYRGLSNKGHVLLEDLPIEKAKAVEKILEETPITNISSTQTIDEKAFWNEIRIYPVPVKDILTIDWTEKVDDLIDNIGLYQQSSVHWVFQKKNANALNRKIQIDMSQQYMGVYILTFTLKDGRRVSKNITKF